MKKPTAIGELKRLLRSLNERPGAAVCCERMGGATSARTAIRKSIRLRIKELENKTKP